MEKQTEENSEKRNFRNILILSCGFMLIIGAWRTTAAIEQTILQSVQVDDPTFTGDGYLSQAIINGVFSVTNFLAPTIISFVGVRTTLVFGTCLYTIFIASFMYPNSWLLYGCSACIGFGSANVWVAYGIYLTRNSSKETIGKYMGMSWAIIASGQLLGNAFVFWKFQGMHHIDYETRFLVIICLTTVGILASVTLIFLGRSSSHHKELSADSKVSAGEKQVGHSEKKNIVTSFTQPFRLLCNKHLLLLIPTAMYNGLEMAFSIAIYPTSVAFSEGFGGDARKLVGVAGILTGVGSLTGGLLFGVILTRFIKIERRFIVLSSCLAHCVSFLLMYLNLSNASPLGPTLDTSWINPPSISVAMLCAFLLGLGDACISTQMSAAIGVIWPNDPSSALAMYRFFQAATCAAGFFIGTLTGLHNQIVIFLAVTLLGTLTFCINERLITREEEYSMNPAVKQIKNITRNLSDRFGMWKQEKSILK